MNLIHNLIEYNIFDYKTLIITSISLLTLYLKSPVNYSNINNDLILQSNKLIKENNTLYDINSKLFTNNIKKEEDYNSLIEIMNDLNKKHEVLKNNLEKELEKVHIDQEIQVDEYLLDDTFNDWLFGKCTEYTSLTNISISKWEELKENDDYLINNNNNVERWIENTQSIISDNSFIDSELKFLDKFKYSLESFNDYIGGNNYYNINLELDNWSTQLIEIINNI